MPRAECDGISLTERRPSIVGGVWALRSRSGNVGAAPSRAPRVVYWNNIPSPYAVARLNAVVSRNNVALEAWFCARTEPDRSWAVREVDFMFPWRYLPGGRLRLPGLGRRYVNLPLGLLRRDRPDLLVS